MNRGIAIGCATAAMIVSGMVDACSCRGDVTLEERYRHADNVLIAKITGCDAQRLSSNGYCRSHGWMFETVENLKGGDARVREQPSDRDGAVNTCDVSLKVGETYLLFLQDGRTALCSGNVMLGEGGDGPGAAQVEMLRAYRDGVLGRISNPWRFRDTGQSCAIDHAVEFVRLQLSYMYANAPQPHAADAKRAPSVMLLAQPPVEFTSPVTMTINGRELSFVNVQPEPPTPARISLAVLTGDAVSSFIEALDAPAELVLSGTRSAMNARPEAFRLTSTTAQAAKAAEEFRACMEEHSTPH